MPVAKAVVNVCVVPLPKVFNTLDNVGSLKGYPQIK